MDSTADQVCFLCLGDVSTSQFFIANMQTKKYKKPYVKLIAELIKPEYELRITSTNRICTYCQQVCETFDELSQQANRVKAVLSRQIASTYSLETDEVCSLDKSKIFIRTSLASNQFMYKCRQCNFNTDSTFVADTHLIYHESVSCNIETGKQKSAISSQISNRTQLESLVDLKELSDPHCNSNVRHNKCVMPGCKEMLYYLCDYVYHLKFHHKASLNQISLIIKTNVKRPKSLAKFSCPYCFTVTSSEESLKEHVVLHEKFAQKVFTEKLNVFISSLIKQSRCKICGAERSDPSLEKCEHKLAKLKNCQVHKCKHCAAFFYDKKLVHNHMAQVHGVCIVCNDKIDEKKVLSEHIRMHFKQNDVKCPLNCKEKGKFKNVEDHMKAKHPENCCALCDHWFVTKLALENHRRYFHANSRPEEKSKVCDYCGASFRNLKSFTEHCQVAHSTQKKMSCSMCKELFAFRYMLIDHMSQAHQRKVIMDDGTFYKCFSCPKTYESRDREKFIAHLNEHEIMTTYCNDCQESFPTVKDFEDHRAMAHLDFSIHVEKIALEQEVNVEIKADEEIVKAEEVAQVQQQITEETEDQQQILIQTEDGSILNMNNLMITENGEIVIQNLDGLLQSNGEELEDGSRVQINNLEQFLLEQGITDTSGFSYVQTDDGQILLQADGSQIEEELQNYQEIFEPPIDVGNHVERKQEITTIENIVCPPIDPSNQSTLDELGDILLEVAAAADKEKTPKMRQVKRQNFTKNGNLSIKRQREPDIEDVPVKDFSQAYEFFVKGFDARRRNL